MTSPFHFVEESKGLDTLVRRQNLLVTTDLARGICERMCAKVSSYHLRWQDG